MIVMNVIQEYSTSIAVCVEGGTSCSLLEKAQLS